MYKVGVDRALCLCAVNWWPSELEAWVNWWVNWSGYTCEFRGGHWQWSLKSVTEIIQEVAWTRVLSNISWGKCLGRVLLARGWRTGEGVVVLDATEIHIYVSLSICIIYSPCVLGAWKDWWVREEWVNWGLSELVRELAAPLSCLVNRWPGWAV